MIICNMWLGIILKILGNIKCLTRINGIKKITLFILNIFKSSKLTLWLYLIEFIVLCWYQFLASNILYSKDFICKTIIYG